jgi:hypothetical protein
MEDNSDLVDSIRKSTYKIVLSTRSLLNKIKDEAVTRSQYKIGLQALRETYKEKAGFDDEEIELLLKAADADY